MKWLRRRRPTRLAALQSAIEAPTPGIVLRISTPNGVVVLADSDSLYYAARYGGADEHGYVQLIAGGGWLHAPLDPEATSEFSTIPIKVEIKAVILP